MTVDDTFEVAAVWVDDIGTDEEEEVIEIKYQPSDESQLNAEPQETPESVPDEKTFLEALPLFISYFDKESTKCILNCRSVCRPWRDAVDNYLTNHFLKSSLSDLERNTYLSNLVYNFPKSSHNESLLNEMKTHSKNSFIGHAVNLHLPTSYSGADMRFKVRDFLEKFGKHIWTLCIDGDWGSLGKRAVILQLITDDLLLNAPNIKNLIISKSSCLGTLEIYGNRHPFEFLERVEISDVSDSLSKALLERLSETQIKILCVDSLKIFIRFEWPTLKQLHLKVKETFSDDDELPTQISRIALQLELLGLDFTGLEFCCPSKSVTFNFILKCFQFTKSLNTIRFYSTPLWGRNTKKSDFSILHKCPENVKTIEVYDNYPEAASVALGNYFDYFFLRCFPHVENLKIFQEKVQGRFLREAACLNETVKVHKFIYDGRMYKSNIWKVMPGLQMLTFGKRIYKRTIVDARRRRRKLGPTPSLSEPLPSSSSHLSLTTSSTNSTSSVDIDPSLKRFSETLPLLSSYLGKKFITQCRFVCRSWRDAVDNYVTASFLKASLSDLQNKPKLSTFLQNFTDISAFDNLPKMEHHPKNPFIGHAVHLHLPEEWALRLIIPKFLKQFGKHIWTLHIDGDWDSFDSGPLLPFITDDVLLPAPNIRNLIISKSLSLGSLEIYGIEKHPFEFLERVEISKVSDVVSKPLLKRVSETQLKILCLDTLDNFIQYEWATLKQLYLKDLRFKDELSIIKAPQLELLELGINMECWSSCKYEYSIFSNILNGLQANTSLNTIRFSFYSTHLWINSQHKRSSNNFTELQKCPENIKTVEIYNACFRVRANYSEGFEFADYSFLICFQQVENLKIVQERIPTQFLSKAARLNDTVKVHQLIYAGKMYESNIWEKIPALQELTFGKKIYKRSSFIRNPKLRIETPGPNQVVQQSRNLFENFEPVVRRTRPRQTARKATAGVPRSRYASGSYRIPGVTPQQAQSSPWF